MHVNSRTPSGSKHDAKLDSLPPYLFASSISFSLINRRLRTSYKWEDKKYIMIGLEGDSTRGTEDYLNRANVEVSIDRLVHHLFFFNFLFQT